MGDSRYRVRVMSRRWLFPWERMKGIYVYVLEFMLTLDKVQITSHFLYARIETWGQSILKVIQAFHTVSIALYIGCSCPVVEDMYAVDNPTTGPEHRIYRTMRTVWNAWITQNAPASGFELFPHYRTGILHFIESEHKYQDMNKIPFILFSEEKITFFLHGSGAVSTIARLT